MALATQCPYCNTTFRVVHDQLKLRAGLVRCGSCKQIFNGIENLSRPEEAAKPAAAPTPSAEPVAIAPATAATEVTATPEPAAAPSLQAQVATFDFSIDGEHDAEATPSTPPPTATAFTQTDAGDEAVADVAPVTAEQDDTATDIETDSAIDSAAPATVPMPAIPDTIPDDPLLRMTLIDFSDVDESVEAFVAGEEALASAKPETDPLQTASAAAAPEENPAPTPPIAAAEAPDEVEQAIDELQRKPWRRAKAEETDELDQLSSADAEEPGFVTRTRRRQRIGRIVQIGVWLGSIILLLGALGQGAYIFRNQLAAWLPQTKPLLTEACTWIHCSVTLPSQLEDVTIESSELQTLAPKKDGFALTLLLRNYSATAQTWPHLELMLNDADEKAIARRIFTPQEYLPPKSDPAKGFAAHSEQPVKITFELLQLTAAGYRVYLFYP